MSEGVILPGPGGKGPDGLPTEEEFVKAIQEKTREAVNALMRMPKSDIRMILEFFFFAIERLENQNLAVFNQAGKLSEELNALGEDIEGLEDTVYGPEEDEAEGADKKPGPATPN